MDVNEDVQLLCKLKKNRGVGVGDGGRVGLDGGSGWM